ncbi:MAG: hypothetical protein Q8Q15_01515 [bacterium]|nr:hypothetical protein [bacterium]
MKNKIFIVLFVLSSLGILSLESGFLGILFNGNGYGTISFSISRFGLPFVFVSLPFILAYFLDWRKGFGLSVLISLTTLFMVGVYLGDSSDEGLLFLSSAFLALFSVFYLLVAFIASIFYKRSI